MEERLRKFAALVDNGTFTKAAIELHVSQPALSTAIAKLERELRTELLVRGARPLQTTAAGQLAYVAAQGVATQTERLKERLAALGREQVTFSIGMTDSVASVLFSSDEVFSELEQNANVSIMVNNSRILLQALEHGELDLAFVVAQSRRLPETLATYFVASEPMVLVCHAQQAVRMHAALKRGKLPRFISYDQSSTTQQLILGVLRQHGIAPSPSFYSTSPEVMLRLVLLEKGAAVLPYLLVQELVRDGTLTLLGNPRPLVIGRRISSAVRRGKHSTISTTAIVHSLGQQLEELYAKASNAQN